MKRFFFLEIVLLFFSITIQSQVTMGSNINPVAGALLDLKEHAPDNDNITSKKGLALPRVSLTKIDELTDLGSGLVENLHIGLTVYNTNECLNSEGYSSGIYTWNGSKWTALEFKEADKSDLEQVTDIDGNTYTAAKFGDAGIWMLENLRTKHYSDGTPIQAAGPMVTNYTQTAIRTWCYPGGNGLNSSYYDENPKLGLLYNWIGATNGENTSTSDQKTNGPNPPVQGACPTGWHIPSYSDWVALEKEINKNSLQYSVYETLLPANNDFSYDIYRESTNFNVENLDSYISMLSPCAQPNSSSNLIGKSFPTRKGGFSALMAGLIGYKEPNISNAVDFGLRAAFITSSHYSGGLNTGYNFMIHCKPGVYGVRGTYNDKSYAMSVRCKKA